MGVSVESCAPPPTPVHTQLKALLQTVEYFERYKLNRKYLKYRPSKTLLEDKKAWWRYAITSVLEEDVKRRTRMWSWKHIRQHRSAFM